MALLRKTVLKILSAVNYYYRAVSVFHHAGKTVLRPAALVNFKENEQAFLTICAASFNLEPDYSRGMWQKEISVTKLPYAMLLGNSGAVVLHDKVVVESVLDQRRLSLSPAWRMPAFMLKKRKAGLYSSVFHFPWAETSNYHWFLDCLPRLVVLAQTVQEPLTLIVNANMPQFQFDTLNYVLKEFPHIDVAYIRKNEKWECEHFLMPSFVANNVSGYLPKEISSFLRNKILTGYRIDPKPPTRKIFISRSRASKRRIKNEVELLPVLERFGFEVVFPETLSYREQVALFHESRIIAGPHGAGFTNTFFAQNATVLELHPATAVKPHYFLLSKGLDLDYHYLIGSEADEKLDFEVSVEAFERKLQEIV
ncbi:glycosyltransferase family 61 protein [Adhaeribacter sp. BT258]|uniref:Glycosyltransferase family 61 protein n=1 Tax=Adhaeribacter terrigena TaxID=2793070 RepID=A0ABS1C540_9BACT|nr:glycosyltransferase family 61 protein [Adhaeribacter terrigena]MBK0403773.1 glycosyltransferase family 61 protein [Adhaeribacter terrigena]